MKRDMDLCRKILFAIEEQYVDTALHNLQIPEYTMEQVAYHCKILKEAGLITNYKALFASNHIVDFGVGSLTWEGHDFLDKIREDTIWNKTKGLIKNKALPMTLDVVKEIASAVISEMMKSAMPGML